MKIQRKFPALVCLMFALAFACLAQTTTAPSPTKPLTADERDAALKNLEATHDMFLKSIAGLSEKQWKFKPAPDRWSVAEVSEHIAVSESSIFGYVHNQIITLPATPEKRAEVKVTDEVILTRVPGPQP